jgi:hypothetical protein
MPRNLNAAAASFTPRPEGPGPLVRTLAAMGWLFVVGAASTVGGCSSGSADQVTGPVALGMTSSMAPYYADGNTTIYQAQKPVELPVRKPTSSERSNPPPKGTPYKHSPYLLASDERLELHYTITNVDSGTHYVWLLIDPWNEFVRWAPGVTVVNDDVTVPNNGYDLAFAIPGKSRVEGTITSDDFLEIATKLASVQAVLGNALTAMPGPTGMVSVTPPGATSSYPMVDPRTLCNNIFFYQNRANSGDALYMPWIPSVIAGVTGFDLGIRTYESANVGVEITVDEVDLNGNRFVVADDTGTKKIGMPPMTLSPPAARF